MKRKYLLWVVSVCLVGLLTAGASADLIVYEGFDFAGLTEGSQITGLAGATSFGFAEPFRMNSSAGAAESGRFLAGGIEGAVVTPKMRGGAITQTVNNSRFYRNFSQPIGAVNGTYYLSFLMSAGQNIALDLSNGDWNSNVKASIGIGDTQSGGVTLKVGSQTSATLAPQNEVHFYVVKIILTDSTDTISIFVDPDLYSPEPITARASFSTTGFSIDRIRFGKYNSNTSSFFDEFRVGETFHDVTPGYGAAILVAPAHNAIAVATNTQLQWQVGNDPNDVEGIRPWSEVAGYYVYIGTGADPNLYLATPTALPAATTSFAPVLARDAVYHWQIEETFDNGLGGVYGPGDPNNVLGSVWTFETELSVPSITQEPAAITRTAVGATVDLSVVAGNALHYTWYYSADNTVGSDTVVGTDSAALSLANVQVTNDGYYYCVVSNNSPSVATSAMARVVINRLLAWYPFENNMDDAVGANPATPAGQPMQYTQGIVAADAQSSAANPDGSMYGVLPASGYPRSGLGNGVERFTYSAWVKLADSTQGGSLLGVLNTGYNTALRFSVNVSGFDISTYMRNQGNTATAVADVGGLDVDNNEWHLVAVTFNGSQLVTYYDGRAVKTVATSITNLTNWDYPMPLLAVNARGTYDGFFKGAVDDLKIYNYAVAPEEMAQLYYDTTGKKACFYGNPEMDFSGNCIVDIADLAIFAADWLTNGFYPAD